MNRTEVIKFIHEHFPCREEHPWAKYPTYAAFKHPENGKWFALVVDIDYEKLYARAPKTPTKDVVLGRSDLATTDVMEPQNQRTGKVDFINLKNDPDLITSLRREPGILPAYHMNKEHWLTVLLDGSADPELLKALIATSFGLTE